MRLLLFLLILFLLSLGIFIYLTKKAIKKLINKFYEENALKSNNAIKIENLIGSNKSSLDQFLNKPNYKPYALTLLINNKIVIQTKNNRLFLSEVKLSSLCEKDHYKNPIINLIFQVLLPSHTKNFREK